MSEGYQRTLPAPDKNNSFYWTSGKDGVMRMLRCSSCGNWVHPPRPICNQCFCQSLQPQPLSGKGEVFSYTINVKAWAPGMAVPYVIAIVRLDEQPGLQLMTNLRGVPAEKVSIGMRVKVAFEQDEDVWIPVFYPDE